MDVIEYNALLHEFMEKVTSGEVKRWQIQRLLPSDEDISYCPPYCNRCGKYSRCPHTPAMTADDLRQHFDQKPWFQKSASATTKFSCLTVPATFENNRAKFLAIDCDSDAGVELIRDKFVKVLEKHNIGYIWETSFQVKDNSHIEKGKLWFFVDCIHDDLVQLMDVLLEQAGLAKWRELVRSSKKTKRPIKIEFYPYQYVNKNIRLPGGYHLRNETVNPIIYKGKKGRKAEFVLKSVIDCEAVSTERIKSIVNAHYKKEMKQTPDAIKKQKDALSRGRHSTDFYYVPEDMPLPKELSPFPPAIEPMFRNCQVLNGIAHQVAKGALDSSGDDVHFVGIQLDNLAVLNDRLLEGKPGEGTGEAWADYIYDVSGMVVRDKTSNNWRLYKQNLGTQYLSPTCKTWNSVLGLCEGCKFKDRPGFTNPRQFIRGKKIATEVIRRLKVTSMDDIRNVEFPEIRRNILNQIAQTDLDAWDIKKMSASATPKDILAAFPTGTGKSYSLVDESIVRLSRKGYNTLLAVPHTRLAIQHKEVIQSLGGRAFILKSFKKIWEHDAPRFHCPEYSAIAELDELGMPSSLAKNKYCKRCPFRNECPYPNQYKEALQPEHNTIIIQHAHLKAAEAMNFLLQKGFHSLFIDEDVTPNMFSEIKPTKEEIKFIKWLKDDIEWMPKLYSWFKQGGAPLGKINFTQYEMAWLRKKFTQAELPWNLSNYLRAYNGGAYYDVDVHLDIFHPLPMIPNRIFTDATPPVDMYKILLNNKKIQVFGQETVLDPKSFHPDNEIYQVLNASASRYAMSQDKYFEAVMAGIGKKSMTEHKDLKILITTFADQKEKAKRFFEVNFPQLLGRLDINHMDIGSNDWEDFNVQWLACSPYYNAKDYAREAYLLKMAQNHWHDYNSWKMPYVDNPYPFGIDEGASYEREEVDLERIVVTNSQAAITRYPDFLTKIPKNDLYELSRKRMVAKKIQSNRLRFKNGKLTLLFDLDKQDTTLPVTRSVLLEDIFQITED